MNITEEVIIVNGTVRILFYIETAQLFYNDEIELSEEDYSTLTTQDKFNMQMIKFDYYKSLLNENYPD